MLVCVTCALVCLCVLTSVIIYSQDVMTRAKRAVHRLVQRVGFFGILLCASVSDHMKHNNDIMHA